MLSLVLAAIAILLLTAGSYLLLRPNVTYEWIERSYGGIVRGMPEALGRRWHERTYNAQRFALRFVVPLALVVTGVMMGIAALSLI